MKALISFFRYAPGAILVLVGIAQFRHGPWWLCVALIAFGGLAVALPLYVDYLRRRLRRIIASRQTHA